MKRVSSRQRLVSWDAFEANAAPPPNNDALSDFESSPSLDQETVISPQDALEYLIPHVSGAYLKRKRVQTSNNSGIQSSQSIDNNVTVDDTASPNTAAALPKAVEAFPWEVNNADSTTNALVEATTSNADKPASMLDRLPTDCVLRVLSFLPLEDVTANVRQVSSQLRGLLESSEAQLFWRTHCCQHLWPHLPSAQEARFTCQEFATLLPLACTSVPTHMDDTLFAPCRWSRSLRRYRARHPHPSVELKAVLTPDKKSAVRFTGTVGTGDRCIRSCQPWKTPQVLAAILPTHRRGPLSRLFPQRRSNNRLQDAPSGRFNPAQTQASFLERLRRGRNQAQAERPLQFRPFVAPVCIASDKFDLTPRLVQYYEVTILEAPTLEDDTSPASASTRFQRTLQDADLPRRNSAECVAVGLSCPEFSLHTRMPGWDRWSYGYHGDDGGVFYGTGHMLRAYGPTFGAGDTVGCGLDYHLRCIFFTLNGRYLGPAWTELAEDMLERDWYPTVGLDTTSWVQANFGSNANQNNNAPFAFDLQAYVQECHTPAIQERRQVFTARDDESESV